MYHCGVSLGMALANISAPRPQRKFFSYLTEVTLNDPIDNPVTHTAGKRVRNLLAPSSFQEALLRPCVFQRPHLGEEKIRGGGVEHSLRVDEL